MKTSNKLLALLGFMLLAGLLMSNYALRKQFDTIDSSDYYWRYSLRDKGDFHHIRISGGN